MVSPIRKYNTEELRERILAAKGTYIIMLDMDNLMRINDGLGRQAGDAALSAMAARIERSISRDMVFFRIGGDEFIVLTNSSDLAACEKITQQMLSYADEDVPYPDGKLKVTFSAGITAIPNDISDPQTALDRADIAMVKAKGAGRSTYQVL